MKGGGPETAAVSRAAAGSASAAPAPPRTTRYSGRSRSPAMIPSKVWVEVRSSVRVGVSAVRRGEARGPPVQPVAGTVLALHPVALLPRLGEQLLGVVQPPGQGV